MKCSICLAPVELGHRIFWSFDSKQAYHHECFHREVRHAGNKLPNILHLKEAVVSLTPVAPARGMFADCRNLPAYGGCWFCNKDHGGINTDMDFTVEFDAYFHMKCLKEELEAHPENPEARIIGREYEHTCQEIKELVERAERINKL